MVKKDAGLTSVMRRTATQGQEMASASRRRYTAAEVRQMLLDSNVDDSDESDSD